MRANRQDVVYISNVADEVTLGRNEYGRNFNVKIRATDALDGVTIGSVVVTRINSVSGALLSTRTEIDGVCSLCRDSACLFYIVQTDTSFMYQISL